MNYYSPLRGKRVLSTPLALLLVLVLTALPLAAQELLTNPGCDDGAAGTINAPTGWSQPDPNDLWQCGNDGRFSIPTHAGTHFFFSNQISAANTLLELQQTVDVSGFAGPLDSGTRTVQYTARYNRTEPNTDESVAFTIDFLDGGGTSVGGAYTSGNLTDPTEDSYEAFDSGIVTIPSGTRQIRVGFLCNDPQATGSDFCDYVFDTFSLTSPSGLPVELTAFAATLDGAVARLTWETASETSNAGFSVEHRVPEAEGFVEAGFVPGAGTAETPRQYAFAVSDLAPGTHAFRLLQTDFDGTTARSDQVEVTVSLEGTHMLEVWPNPVGAAGIVRLALAEAQAVTLSLYDALGRRVALLHEGAASGTLEAQVPPSLPAGVYLLYAEGERFAETLRLTVVR